MMLVLCFVLGFLSGAVIAWARLQRRIRMHEAVESGMLASYASKLMQEAAAQANAPKPMPSNRWWLCETCAKGARKIPLENILPGKILPDPDACEWCDAIKPARELSMFRT